MPGITEVSAMIRFEQTRRSGRPRKNSKVGLVERLEDRQLMAYSPLGYSLPDLTVSGTVAPTAAYGHDLAIRLDVRNLGASSLYEPLALEPGAPSTADAPPSHVGVFISRTPHFGYRTTIKIADVEVPAVPQNSVVTVNTSVQLPAYQPGFPVNGKTIYVFFKADNLNEVLEADKIHNLNRKAQPVLLQLPLPELSGVTWDVPAIVQPGDALRPTIKVANFGTVNTDTQGPFNVYLVASDDNKFGPGDTILQVFTIDSLPGLNSVPLAPHSIDGDLNTIYDQPNVVTLTSDQVVTPHVPGPYYIGVFVDPEHAILQLHDTEGKRPNTLFPSKKTDKPIPGLPPAGILQAPAPDTNLFPIPAFGPLMNGASSTVTTLMVADPGTYVPPNLSRNDSETVVAPNFPIPAASTRTKR